MGEWMNGYLEKLAANRRENLEGGGKERIEIQHGLGKLTARERINLLSDPDSFKEIGSLVRASSLTFEGTERPSPSDGDVTGTARVNDRLIMIYASDFTVLGGSIGTQHGSKSIRALKMAAEWGVPMVNLLDSSGGRLGYTDVERAGLDWSFRIQSVNSGVVPQITVLMGSCIAGGAYLPTLCDFLLISRVSGTMWLGGPRQTQAATSEKIDRNIGGADYHMELSGSCDIVGNDDEETIKKMPRVVAVPAPEFQGKDTSMGADRQSGPGSVRTHGYCS